MQQPTYPQADFAVTSVTGPGSIRLGDYFLAAVTVCNQGTETDTTVVSLYLSADMVITPDVPLTPASDQRLKQFGTPSLAPGQCHTETAHVQASASIQGTYFLGAIARPSNAFEPNQADNTRVSAPIGIGDQPDFVVTSVTGPTSVPQGQPFPASVTVCNPGTAPGTPHVALYLSADAVITPDFPLTPASDLLLGSRSMGMLAPGKCQTETLTVSASVHREGAYHLGAIVDPAQAVPELVEINNTHAATRIGVGARPDFVVTSVTGPESALPGQALSSNVQVCNQGTTPGSAPVELYLTADDIVTPQMPPNLFPDVWMGMQTSGTLEPGACKTLSFMHTPPGVAPGAFRLGAIVNPMGDALSELRSDNNIGLSPRFGIGVGPDLIATAINGPVSHAPGQPFSASVEVCNQGTASAGATQVTLSLVASSGGRALVGTASVNPLAADACETVVVAGTPHLFEHGTHTLDAHVDPSGMVNELVEDNNARVGHRVGVGMLPDLVIRAITGPASIQPGQPLSADIEVCNQGTHPIDTSVDLYVSSDADITPGADVHVGRVYSNFLAPGDCQVVTASGDTFGVTPGAKYLGAIADVMNNVPELFEDNNAHTGPRLGVGNGPDFIVKTVTAPATLSLGTPIAVTLEVCNQGTQTGQTPVDLFLSQDTLITPPGGPNQPGDYPLRMLFTDPIAPGQCQTLSTLVHNGGGGGTGTSYLGAIANLTRFVPELIYDNNTQVSAPITFTY
ncbi:CARDB domain-containing protein [Myxococcus hansupus]|uniref:CARDB domain-containing protein n=1 Tax=Pseudomyxococcus hansupus TaxID=1297742 RepID=UPI001314FE01|nr:CARDB domain-containing protein [Myxococcus hansupus]